MEMKMYGGDPDASARQLTSGRNIVVATSRRAHREGWAAVLRVVNINNTKVRASSWTCRSPVRAMWGRQRVSGFGPRERFKAVSSLKRSSFGAVLRRVGAARTWGLRRWRFYIDVQTCFLSKNAARTAPTRGPLFSLPCLRNTSPA